MWQQESKRVTTMTTITDRLLRHARANAVAYLALFVALGGTSYAAVHIAAHSIGPRELRPHSIGPADLRPHSITDEQIKVGSLKVRDFAADQLPQAASASYHGELSVPAGGTVEVPLQDATWTQAASEDDLLIPGLQVKLPSACVSPKGATGLVFTVAVDDQSISGLFGFQSFVTAPAGSVQSLRPQMPTAVLHTGSAQQHHVTVQVKNECEGAGQDYVVMSAGVDVVNFTTG
jgi:hypothetical protein